MKTRVTSLLLLAAALGSCAPGRPYALAGGTDDVRVPWAPGTYRVSGVLQYREDSSTSQRTRRAPLAADLVVDAEGPVGLSVPAGPCVLDPRLEEQQQYVYRCGETTYTVSRAPELRVQAFMDVTEVKLGPRACVEQGPDARGNWVCLKYEQALTSEMRRVGTRMRLERVGPR